MKIETRGIYSVIEIDGEFLAYRGETHVGTFTLASRAWERLTSW